MDLFMGSKSQSGFVKVKVPKMKRFTNLWRSKSHDASGPHAPEAARDSSEYDFTNAPADSPEATARRAIHLFCESGSSSNGGEEVLHLPVIVDAAESSPTAAAAAAHQIRRFLSKQYGQKPHVQYNAVMLIRILCENPGATFTRNFDAHFVATVKECLRSGRDASVQQILRETLDSLEVQRPPHDGCGALLAMWRKEKGGAAHLGVGAAGSGVGSGGAAAAGGGYEQVYYNHHHHHRGSGNGLAAVGRAGSRSRGRLPAPAELASRIEEATNTAKILMQLLQSTPAEEVLRNELIKEFSERCQSAQKSMQGYIACDDPAPDDDTLQTLIETNEQLSLAVSRYQRAVLAARRAAGVNASPSPTPPLGQAAAVAPAVQEPQPQPVYGNGGYFQRASQPPTNHELDSYQAPTGLPPATLNNTFQQRDSQAYQPAPTPLSSQPTATRTSTSHPTPPQQYTLPSIPRSDPFADPIEHQGNPAPTVSAPSHPRSFTIEPDDSSIPTHAAPAAGGHGRRQTVDLENAYSNPVSPATDDHSQRREEPHDPLSVPQQQQQQQPRPGLPWHTSEVTDSYVQRQGSALQGLTMHGAEPAAASVETVSEIDSLGREGRSEEGSRAEEGEEGEEGEAYVVSPVEGRKGFRRSLLLGGYGLRHGGGRR